MCTTAPSVVGKRAARQVQSVCVVTTEYAPFFGGVATVVASQVDRMSARGLRCILLAPRQDSRSPTYEQPRPGVEIYRLPIALSTRVLGTITWITVLPAALMMLRRRYDVIHVHQLGWHAALAVETGRMLGKPVVVHPQSYRSDEQRDVTRSPIVRFALASSRHANCIVVSSDEVAKNLVSAGFPADKIELIANGVDSERFKPLANAKLVKPRELSSRPDAKIVLYVGRLDPLKGLDTLLRAWPSVVQAHANVVLVLVGVGPFESRLRTMAHDLGIADTIIFAGRQQDAVPYYQAADIFVLPSQTEGLSVALLEAMSTGLAVITTPVGHHPDVIQHLHNGVLVAVGDDRELATRIVQLLSNDNLRATLGKAAHETVMRNYSLDQTISKMIDLYNVLLQSGT